MYKSNECKINSVLNMKNGRRPISKIAAFFPEPQQRASDNLPTSNRSKFSQFYDPKRLRNDNNNLYSQSTLTKSPNTKQPQDTSQCMHYVSRPLPPFVARKRCSRENMQDQSRYSKSHIISSQEVSASLYSRQHQGSSKEIIIRKNYFSPQEFFLGRSKPVRPIREDTLPTEVRSPEASARPDRKDFFSHQQLNEDTVKLRKSLSSFHENNKPQVLPTPSAINKSIRANSQYTPASNQQPRSDSKERGKKSQSEEKIKVVDIFNEKKAKNTENKLKTIIRNEYQPSMVERNMTKKFNLNRNNPPPETQMSTNITANYFSAANPPCALPSRSRIYSTKTPQKFLQQHFGERLNESRDILMKLQNKNSILTNQTTQQDSPQLPKQEKKLIIPETKNILNSYFNDSPLLPHHDRKQFNFHLELNKEEIMLNEYQIKKQQEPTLLSPSYPKQSSDHVRGLGTERILDLLLLSTGELKNHFKKSVERQKNVKLVQKQRFPGDFFSALNQHS